MMSVNLSGYEDNVSLLCFSAAKRLPLATMETKSSSRVSTLYDQKRLDCTSPELA